MKILIIDDEINVTTTLKALLTSQGNFEIDLAFGGREGLDKMIAANPNYDLLILDLMMMGFNGIDVCREMAKNEKIKNIPVLLATALPITSHELEETLNEFKSLVSIRGALEKPFVVSELLAEIQKIA